jgi:hypothetical protein
MDIKYTKTGDLDLSSGDIKYADGTEQHKLTTFLSGKGELKERPDLGVGVADYLMDENPSELLRECRRQCERIGIKVSRVLVENGILKIVGEYGNDSNS